LFSDKDGFESAVLPSPADPGQIENERRSLIERAKAGDQSALNEAHALSDQKFYDQVLDQLTANADSMPTLLSLVSYVTRNEFRVNRKLAESIVDSWKNAPDRTSTPKTLHIAALTDDADLYSITVQEALNFWRRDCSRMFRRQS